MVFLLIQFSFTYWHEALQLIALNYIGISQQLDQEMISAPSRPDYMLALKMLQAHSHVLIHS